MLMVIAHESGARQEELRWWPTEFETSESAATSADPRSDIANT